MRVDRNIKLGGNENIHSYVLFYPGKGACRTRRILYMNLLLQIMKSNNC